jgi:hypothetical protein
MEVWGCGGVVLKKENRKMAFTEDANYVWNFNRIIDVIKIIFRFRTILPKSKYFGPWVRFKVTVRKKHFRNLDFAVHQNTAHLADSDQIES